MITRHFSTPQYRKLFKVNFLHEFYHSGKSNDFEVRPTKETLRFMSNHKLLFREIEGGIVVLYAKNREVDFMTEGLNFSFVAINKNSTFTHFSAIPFDINTGKAYHFNNWNDKEVGEEEGQGLTQKHIASDDDRVPFAYQMFEYAFDEPKTNIEITITDDFGNQVFQNQVGDTPIDKQDIDLREEPLAKYHLFINKVKKFTFYTCNASTSKGFGMIDIRVSKDIESEHSIWNSATQEVTPRDYVICFAERKTYWRYHFIKRKEKVDYRDYEIVHTHHDPDFLPPETITLSNGTPAIRIESKYPISLKERLEGMYQLKVKKNGKGLNTSLNLPTPPVRMVKPDNKNTAKVYSDMYVYL